MVEEHLQLYQSLMQDQFFAGPFSRWRISSRALNHFSGHEQYFQRDVRFNRVLRGS